MKRAAVNLIAFGLAFAVAALAGWDTTLFDGLSNRRGYGWTRSVMTYTANVERVRAHTSLGVWSYYVTVTPRRKGSSWTLEEAKSDIYFMLGSPDAPLESKQSGWIDTANIHASGEYAISTNTFGGNIPSEDLPLLDYDNILSYAGAPTNWFDVHPRKAVPLQPTGWKYVDDVYNEMVIAAKYYSYTNATATSSVLYYGKGKNDTWSGAVSAAQADASWININDTAYSLPRNYTTGSESDGEYTAKICMEHNDYRFQVPTTNYNAEVSLYMGVYGLLEFDGGAYNLTEDKFNLIEKKTYTAGPEYIEFTVGRTNSADAMDFTATVGNKGWSSDYAEDSYFMLWWKYDVTNGFEYVE